MISSSIARRYAKALFSLADEKGQIEQWSKGLDALAGVLDLSRELQDVLENPRYDKETRRAVLRRVAEELRLDAEPTSLLHLLVDRSRLAYLPAILSSFRVLADGKLGRVRARVTSAVPLGADESRRIAEKLAQATRAEVILETAVEPALLGGVVTQVGSLVYDGSVRTQLEELRHAMKQK
jgi:F-type H+-transporting ATPase subunit delta